MFRDPLTLKYLLLALLAIWGVLVMLKVKRRILAYLLGTFIFIGIVYLALGSGFSIRFPYPHNKMEIIVYTVYEDRVHALAHPLNQPGEPMHIVFSVDPDTRMGAQMRKSFFDAVRAREGKRHQTNIIINMRGYMTELGEYKYDVISSRPPKDTNETGSQRLNSVNPPE